MFVPLGDPEWTQATLANGWVDYSGGAFPGSPWHQAAFRKVTGNIVELRGLIKDGQGYKTAFVLPEGYRPAAHLMFPAASQSGPIRVDVGAGGGVVIQASNPGYVSLAGIYFWVDDVEE